MCISLISVSNSENAMQALNMVILCLEPSLKGGTACEPTTQRVDKFLYKYGVLKLNQMTNTWLICNRQWNQGRKTLPRKKSFGLESLLPNSTSPSKKKLTAMLLKMSIAQCSRCIKIWHDCRNMM